MAPSRLTALYAPSSSSASLMRRSIAVRQELNGGSPQQWSVADQLRLTSVADENGQFNGTCNAASSSLAPQPNAGECESYYSDVTVYCCGAVGGMLETTTQQEASEFTGEGQASAGDAALTLLSCRTTDPNKMLQCYKFTAEEHCRSAISGPWGVCNTADATSNANSSTSTTSEQQQVSIATGASSAAPPSLHARRWVGGAGGAALYALFFTSALMLLLGEASA